MVAAHRLYGVFWTEEGRAMWGLSRNGRQARKAARTHQGLCLSMQRFRVCSDRLEADYRPEGAK
jgi:hypothetical protein